MYTVEMIDITKRFGAVVANDHVTFTAHAGEVHALLGENGAGKSTLMSILAGLYRPDEGAVKLNNKPVHFHGPRDAIDHGIGIVYQHFMLVDSFTVAENVMLGQHGRGARLDTNIVERELAELGKRYSLQIDPRAHVWQLSVGEQQRVEILRLLHRHAKVLIFDEPTAVLTPQEAHDLLGTMRNMAREGYCIIFISHHLDEVMAVADRITVLRRGGVVTTVETRATTQRELARMMVGRDLLPPATPPSATPGDVVLDVRNVQALGDKGLPALVDINLQVRAGEILGIAGVAGNGQRELAEVITGLRRVVSGQVHVCGTDLTNRSSRRIMEAGVAHVPEDRLGTGMIANLSLADNAILKDYRHAPLRRGPFLNGTEVAHFTDRLVAKYNVSAPGREAKVRLLSGGNQQKMLLARELSGEPQLLVAVHPTRGVDVGSTEVIHQLLLAQRARGAAVLLIGEDLGELLALSDRIAVMYGGRIMGTVHAADADTEHVGLMMAGMPLAEAMGGVPPT